MIDITYRCDFRIEIKDRALWFEAKKIIENFPKLFPIMTLEEILKYHTCNYLMEYKLLIYKIGKRLENNKN